jgi:hypothetical protein
MCCTVLSLENLISLHGLKNCLIKFEHFGEYEATFYISDIVENVRAKKSQFLRRLVGKENF